MSKAEVLARIEAEVLELPTPVGVRIPQALNIDAAREASFDRRLYELGSKEGE
jgi:hypothetical protein